MWLKKLNKKLSNSKVGVIIALFYFALIVASTAVSSLFYEKIYLNITQKKVSEVSVQTLNSIQTNINLMINNADSLSKMVLSNSDLQKLLRQGSMYEDLNTQAKVSSYLYKFIQSVPYVSSVYILDNSNNIYSVGADVLPSIPAQKIIDAKWYKRVMEKKGGFILELNGGGVSFENSKDNYVSLIRLVRDMDNVDKLGVLVINIPQKSFKQVFDNISNDVETNIAVLDEENQKITSLKNVNEDKENVHGGIDVDDEMMRAGDEFVGNDIGYKMKKIDKTEYLITYSSKNDYNWKFVSVIPFAQLYKENMTMIFIGFVIILFNGIILFVCSVGISRIVTTPIKYLLNSMKDIEKGVFNEVQIKAHGYELKKLCRGYNIMIAEIKKLIARVIQEQKMIRKAELYTFQAQIKPHFLYNTLDSINSLALSGCNREVSELVEALGNYYRTSVSKGKEIITIGEEIEMVKNYLKIQKIRYPDLFEVEYSVEAGCLEYKIPKLILQPLAENALYHGIRENGKSGTIKISAHMGDGVAILSVEDDGAGMSDEQTDDIMNINNKSIKESFGLRGTLERIKIFYGDDDACKIESKLGEGTKILLYINIEDKED
ncbi:cache domain-containing sensor histidine kinase [Clostridium beijerinckii]|uniref:Two-component system sensor histidine kinase YesM n=1 Tax=Clostridium beijerinckii TaxID=1520 RepID=A0AAE5HAE5_CLOBE|nr:sensor histidine kinase [Clostridium beijerinckii]NSB16975.1 two-component system sensor histidine kinase YesM [Clostridium beijerinckii]OOM20839.1 sensor histidine kinase YehU [Clostridium beijerinckii]UYZ35844.1 histidine kinase [Clostridium beijerinckii]